MEMNMELSETYYQQYKTNDQRNNLISPQDKKKIEDQDSEPYMH